MNDYELLLRAAAAAGLIVHEGESRPELGILAANPGHAPGEAPYIVWNPLVDDGDAMRLLVSLDMSMLFNFSCERDIKERKVWSPVFGGNATEQYGDGPYASTRRAIVRAAASMPSK